MQNAHSVPRAYKISRMKNIKITSNSTETLKSLFLQKHKHLLEA
jgi:hypothetical protein